MRLRVALFTIAGLAAGAAIGYGTYAIIGIRSSDDGTRKAGALLAGFLTALVIEGEGARRWLSRWARRQTRSGS